MEKLERFGKETKILLYGITAVCILSFALLPAVSGVFAKTFQKELLLHDYSVAGSLLRNPGEMAVSAFTSEKEAADIKRGKQALGAAGYDEETSMRLLPSVSAYRGKVTRVFFVLFLFIFGMVYSFIFFYLYRQHKIITRAQKSIREFLEGRTDCRMESEQTGGWYSLMHEINELAAVLSAHAQKEKQVREFLQNIISDVSHQLKTPLSALRMYDEIISDSASDSKTVRDFSKKSLREIKRIENTVHTLLKLARLDAGMIPMQKTKENLSALIQDVLEQFEIRAEREKKTIEVTGDSGVFLFCDALWMSEAVGNIVKNALEHTEQGGHIFIHWQQTPLLTQIVIKDDGAGIHPEDFYHIFKRFYRSRFSKDAYGTGLGLPLAKTIVENHGGNISVTGGLGAGAEFTLNFCNLTKE